MTMVVDIVVNSRGSKSPERSSQGIGSTFASYNTTERLVETTAAPATKQPAVAEAAPVLTALPSRSLKGSAVMATIVPSVDQNNVLLIEDNLLN